MTSHLHLALVERVVSGVKQAPVSFTPVSVCVEWGRAVMQASKGALRHEVADQAGVPPIIDPHLPFM